MSGPRIPDRETTCEITEVALAAPACCSHLTLGVATRHHTRHLAPALTAPSHCSGSSTSHSSHVSHEPRLWDHQPGVEMEWSRGCRLPLISSNGSSGDI